MWAHITTEVGNDRGGSGHAGGLTMKLSSGIHPRYSHLSRLSSEASFPARVLTLVFPVPWSCLPVMSEPGRCISRRSTYSGRCLTGESSHKLGGFRVCPVLPCR